MDDFHLLSFASFLAHSLKGQQEAKTDATTRGRRRSLPTSRPAVICLIKGEPIELPPLMKPVMHKLARHGPCDSLRRTRRQLHQVGANRNMEARKEAHPEQPIHAIPIHSAIFRLNHDWYVFGLE